MGLEDQIQGLRVGLPQNFTNSTKKKVHLRTRLTPTPLTLCFDERGETVLVFFFGGWGEAPDVRLGNAAEVFKAVT